MEPWGTPQETAPEEDENNIDLYCTHDSHHSKALP